MNTRSKRQKIFCWGRNASGELGLTSSNGSSNVVQPVALEGFQEDVLEIASGRQHTVFLLANGLVYSCGSDDEKQLGYRKDGTTNSSKPGKLILLDKLVSEALTKMYRIVWQNLHVDQVIKFANL